MAIPGRGRAHPSSDTSAAHARDSRPHRHPGFWPDPAGFDPRRFLPGGAADTATRHRYAFIPFGGGRRACIGASFAELETVLVLATVACRCACGTADRRAISRRVMSFGNTTPLIARSAAEECGFAGMVSGVSCRLSA